MEKMNNENLYWEEIERNGYMATDKLKVDGGYLYRTSTGEGHIALCFIPDAQPNVSQDGELNNPVKFQDYVKGELERLDKINVRRLNEMAELSLKLNTLQSDLREFEKQKVEPLARKVDMCENHDVQETKMVRQFIRELEKRLEKRESETCQHHWDYNDLTCKKCHPFESSQKCNSEQNGAMGETTGLTLAQAVEAVKHGKRITRAAWDKFSVSEGFGEFLDWDDVIADDWMVLE